MGMQPEIIRVAGHVAHPEHPERLPEILAEQVDDVLETGKDEFVQAVIRMPFLLALGDYVYRAEGEESCTRQLLDVYERHGTSVVGVKPIPEAHLGRFGCVGGRWVEEGSLLEVAQFIEKPDVETARTELRVEGLPAGEYLGLFGQYVLAPAVFDLLSDGASARRKDGAELQLTPSLDRLRIQEGFLAYRVRGASYDIGVPESYRESVWLFGERRRDPPGR